ncbi:hypothetical protein [Streptomyces sp. URMC 123]|uniref:hypothetical protein n=1 Tax=Streptomyces sp. URMC 123 TaxID=3423403 RepID=UPI003F1D901E
MTGRDAPRHAAAERPEPVGRHAMRAGVFTPEPHPTGAEVVGRYVHTYDASARSPYPSHIPAMRHSQDPMGVGQQSATPIYDALYAEYRRSFRALPGDRSGEEELRFRSFRSQSHSGAWERLASWDTGGRQHRGLMPPALPPAPRDNRRYGL